MGEFYPKTERQILTHHDVLGAPRYSAQLEEVSLDTEAPHTAFASTTSHFPGSYDGEPLSPKPSSRTDKVLLLLFGITTADLHGLGKILAACAIVSVLVLIGLIIHILFGPPQVTPHGAVAADVKICSALGVEMLEKGGSAVDAAIAALFCLQVVNPQSSGIGGGGFMLVYDHRTRVPWYVDFRETAPEAFKVEMMDERFTKPYLLIGVPGELRGMQRAHSLYGRLSWSSLVLPAARLATEGFVVTKALASEIWRLDKIKDLPSSTRLKNFLYKNGKPLQPGETVTRPDLGHTLERIAYGGAEEFYSGRLGSQIVDEIREIGGLLSKVDLMNYKEIIKEPLTSSFKDYRVITAPPPSSGPAFILALNILEGFNFTKDDINNPLFWHRFIEVLKFETANKNRLGDPDYEPAVLEIARHMMLKSTADNLRRQMKDDAVLSDYSIGVNVSQRSQVGTTHVSIVDSKELYVSVTSTLNYYFGSGFMTATGIIMNDELTDFASKDMTGAEQNNMPKPGKRPLSSMVPTVIYHPLRACIHRMAVGGSNGSHIPSGVLASIINVLTFGLNLTEAVEHPRLFADLPTNPVLAESGFDEKILSQLEVWGHNITRTPGLSVINAVMRNNKTVTAHSDSRKYGDAVIY